MKTRLRKGKICLETILMLVVLVFTSMIQVVSAAETTEFQKVIDTANLLAEEQVSGIKEKINTLELFDMALYIENKEESQCTQEYANSLSKEKYNDVFGAEYKNGVMIVFTFYKEANGYYAITYGGNLEIDERKMSNIIEGTYHDFPTDATWVEGAFEQCVDYIKDVEYNVIHADEIKAQKEAEARTFKKVISIALIVILLIAAIYFFFKCRKNEIEYDENIRNLKRKMSEDRSKLNNQISEYQYQLEELESWQKNAILTVPDIEEQIDEYLARKEAENFDKAYSELEDLEPTISNFKKFEAAFQAYNQLSKEARSFVEANCKVIMEKYDLALKSYVSSAEATIISKMEPCDGSRHYRNDIREIRNYYSGLPVAVRLLITASLINRLNDMERSADRDYRRHQEATSYHHQSSHTSYGGSFGGGFHGGGTFGGGFGGGH